MDDRAWFLSPVRQAAGRTDRRIREADRAHDAAVAHRHRAVRCLVRAPAARIRRRLARAGIQPADWIALAVDERKGRAENSLDESNGSAAYRGRVAAQVLLARLP